MIKIVFALPFLALFVHTLSFSNCDPKTDKPIVRQSQKFAEVLRTENLETLQSIFDADAYLLPEYHQTLHGLDTLSDYYAVFFNKAETVSYAKVPFEIQQIGELYLELGTFEHRYKTPKGNLFDYNGKYMTYWKQPKGGSPKILAHIWGASSYFEADNVNFVNVEGDDPKFFVPSTVWERQIDEVRRYVYEAVLRGDAKKQLETYADDAIYMTYYDAPFKGKEAISKYYYAHYDPGASRDSLMTRAVNVVELGDYALKFGEYYVEWTQENKPYYIQGKGLTLYRRRTDGRVEIYRQMINHSMPPTLKKE